MNKKVIWTIVLIVGLYVACQLLADVGATKLAQIGNVVMPGGTFVFAITFTLRDLIHKRLGKTWAQAAIVVAAALNIFVAGYLMFVANLGYPPFFAAGEAWGMIFAIVPAITLGSIAAELMSELIDTEVYDFWQKRFTHLPQWSRVLVSNMISLPIDSIVFTFLAFVVLPPLFGGEAMPLGDAVARLASGQIIYKAIVAFVSMPLIYAVKDKPLTETI